MKRQLFWNKKIKFFRVWMNRIPLLLPPKVVTMRALLKSKNPLRTYMISIHMRPKRLKNNNKKNPPPILLSLHLVIFLSV